MEKMEVSDGSMDDNVIAEPVIPVKKSKIDVTNVVTPTNVPAKKISFDDNTLNENFNDDTLAAATVDFLAVMDTEAHEQNDAVQNNLPDNPLQGKLVIDLNNAPVIEIPTVECKTDFEYHVVHALSIMSKDISMLKEKQEENETIMDMIQSINRRQEEIVTFILDKKVVKITEGTIDFTRKFNWTFPINSLEEFEKFDKEVETKQFLKNDVVVQMTGLIDSDLSITKSFVKILKFLMTKEVAEKYTTVRQSRPKENIPVKKLRFVSTATYGIMCGVLKFKRGKKNLETTDKILMKGISEVICNIKTWH